MFGVDEKNNSMYLRGYPDIYGFISITAQRLEARRVIVLVSSNPIAPCA